MSSNNLYVHHQQERLIIIIRIDIRRLKGNNKFNDNTLILMEVLITVIVMASAGVIVYDPVVKVAAVAKEVEAQVVHHRRDNNI